jgi:SAM-dependent methyltransferase
MASSHEPARAVGPDDQVEDMVEPAVPERLGWLVGLLDARPGERVADLGCGTGAVLSLLAEGAPLELVGLDASAAALRVAAGALDGHPGSGWLLVQADLADPLPLAERSLDRVVCHNVLECLPEPEALLEEATRVLRPGGRLVLSHTDFDTLVFSSEDRALTRRLVHAYSDTQQDWMAAVDGTIGRRLPDLVGRSRLRVDAVEANAVASRVWAPGELGYGYAHNLVAALTRARAADPDELASWLRGLARLAERDAFLFSLNDYAVVATAPAGGPVEPVSRWRTQTFGST